MRKSIVPFLLLVFAGLSVLAEVRILRTGINHIDIIIDGKRYEGGWTVMPQKNPDLLEAPVSEVIFISDVDTLAIDNLREWEARDFVILTAGGDSAHVRVRRTAANPYDNPDPELLTVAKSGKLSKAQAAFDIDALVNTLTQVHPDIFSVCRQVDFFTAVNKAKESLPDSVTPMELYQAAAPFVSMIGDGHTTLGFPGGVFTPELKRLPVYFNVLTDGSLFCTSSLDSVIGRGDRVLAINGVSADSIIESMMPYVSGERRHFKMSEINMAFTALFQMLYAADEYQVEYQPKGGRKTLTHTFPATSWDEIKKRCPSTKSRKKFENYSYTVDSVNGIAVMDFRNFTDIDGMAQFADSMFRELAERNIPNLIIDIRNNGGGNSGVGDVLLSYLSPEPFVQMERMLVRTTPTTAKLMGRTDVTPQFVYFEADSTSYTLPRSLEDGHYTGNVYLLTSNTTFSSASAFAWTFKVCGMGKVIGEETGGMNVSYGDVLRYKLPISKIPAFMSYKRFWQFRADEDDIHGTIPDVALPAADALDTAIELAKKNKPKQ